MNEITDLEGTPREIGLQMGMALRRDSNKAEAFLEFLAHENDSVKRLSTYTSQQLDELWAILSHASCDIAAWVEGLGEGVGVSPREIFLFNIGSYFRDLAITKNDRSSHLEEECSTFAVSYSREGPILAKNRDCAAPYAAFQAVIRTHPKSGLGYIAMTTHGVAGVHSSGMNERGLAVADTHVTSLDIGCGLPRFALMHKLLNQCVTVDDALGIIMKEMVMGRGNLILADVNGALGVAELGHHACMVRRANAGVMVNTNHFTDLCMERSFIDTNPLSLKGTSKARYSRLSDLISTEGHTLAEAKQIMAYHGGALDSLCRHEELEPPYRTISTVLYLPQQRKMVFSDGYPCRKQYRELTWE